MRINLPEKEKFNHSPGRILAYSNCAMLGAAQC